MFWETGRYIGSVLPGMNELVVEKIVVPLAQQLSRSHLTALLPNC
jgi:hypothetical protein